MMKVLIVEDDPMVALINRKYIERIGQAEVFGPVTTEEEIFNILKEQTIELILLDEYLPQKNGLEILEALRANHYYTHVIMITAANQTAEVKKAFAFGVIDYLMKPFEFSRFKQAVEKHLKQEACLGQKERLMQEDLDHSTKRKGIDQELPKGLNEKTLLKLMDILKEKDTEEWTLRRLAEKMQISNVTIKKYMDYLEEVEQVSVEMSSGQVGRPEYKYKMQF